MHITHINLAKGFGGGERQTTLLIEYMAGHGLNQHLVCRKDSPLREYLQETPGLSFHAADNMFRGHRFGRMETDLYHAHDAKAAHWVFLETRFCRIPYIVTRRVLNPLKKYGITPVVYKKAARVVAISSQIKSNLAAYSPGLPVNVIPSSTGRVPFSGEHIETLQKRYEGRFLIGHIGILKNEVKGQQYIMEAARHLRKKYNNLHFVFLGKGEDETKLKALAGDMKHIEFAGYTNLPGDYLSVMDLFVFPSSREGFGSSILDAMAYGVPVIASDVGGIPDIVEHEQNGILIPPRNSRALADAISRLYENPGLRKQFSDKGRETAAAFSPEAMGERYLALYRKILDG